MQVFMVISRKFFLLAYATPHCCHLNIHRQGKGKQPSKPECQHPEK